MFLWKKTPEKRTFAVCLFLRLSCCRTERESHQTRVEKEDGGGLKSSISQSYYRSLHSAMCRSLFEIHSEYILPFMVMRRISSWEQLHAVHVGRMSVCVHVSAQQLALGRKKTKYMLTAGQQTRLTGLL